MGLELFKAARTALVKTLRLLEFPRLEARGLT
jgi:hypothetical protein